MRRAGLWTRSARIGDIAETVEAVARVSLPRVFDAHQVLITEPVVDLDVVLIVGALIRSGTNPIRVRVVARRPHAFVGKRIVLHELERNRIDQVARIRWKLVFGPVKVWAAWAHVSRHVVERYVSGPHGAARTRVVQTGIRIPKLPAIRGTTAVGVETSAGIPAQFSKVACSLGGARHTELAAGGGSAARAVIVEEKESLVFLDRPAYRAAKIVVAQRRDGHAALIIEPVVSIQFLIAEELVEAAMELVGA